MTLTWRHHYRTNGTFCSTEGLAVDSAASFRKYLTETVRPEWERWLTLDPTMIQSMDQSGFSSAFIEKLRQSGIGESSDTALKGDFGEVFASLFLNSQYGMDFPWPAFWDRKTPEASLSGSDLVGIARDREGALFVVGQVKASSEDRCPPTVVSNRRHGLVAQLHCLRRDSQAINSHLKWLLTRAAGAAWEQDFLHALQRVSTEPLDVMLVGVLVRDTTPSDLDLKRAHDSFAENKGARVFLFGCYLPLSLHECIQLAGRSSDHGSPHAN